MLRLARRVSPLLAPTLVLAGLTAGCAGSSPEVRTFFPAIFRSAEQAAPAPASGRGKGRVNPAASGNAAWVERAQWVERSLKARGLRFGTDGTPEALFAYVRFNHRLVKPNEARAGDLLFFDLGGRGCGDHIGIVDAVDTTGRITFRERREGPEDRRSFVFPEAPAARRDQDGRVLNSFLRPRRIYDAPGTRYFAGEMLCAVGRVQRPR